MRWKSGVIQLMILQTAQGTINPEVYQTSAEVFQSRVEKELVDPSAGSQKNYFKNSIILKESILNGEVSSIPLDFGATDQIEEFQVTFNYLFYEVQTYLAT